MGPSLTHCAKDFHELHVYSLNILTEWCNANAILLNNKHGCIALRRSPEERGNDVVEAEIHHISPVLVSVGNLVAALIAAITARASLLKTIAKANNSHVVRVAE